jgi:hypothetical protein
MQMHRGFMPQLKQHRRRLAPRAYVAQLVVNRT